MRTLPVFFALVLVPLQGQVPEVRTTAKDRTALSVTIYQSGLAAIRDTRRVSLPAGPSRLAFADLVPTLRPKSATLLDPGGGLQVRERNYEFNLLSPATLVDASLGLPVRIKGEEGQPDQAGTLASVPLLNPRMRPDAKPLERIAKKPSAYVQSPDPEVVVTTSEGIRSWMPGDLALTQVPPQLRTSPTLLQDLVAPAAGKRDLTLLYTATDLTWEANYVATLASDGKHLDLDVFATVKNNSSQSLEGCSLQLMAGWVEWAPDIDDSSENVDKTYFVEVLASSMAGPPAFQEEKVFEYPLFTLDRPVTIRSRSEKQLTLFTFRNVPVVQKFLVECPYNDYLEERPSTYLNELSPPFRAGWEARRYPPVQRIGTIQNDDQSSLGRALPGGPLTLRYEDPSGALLLLPRPTEFGWGFPETAPGESIELSLGPARGIHVSRRKLLQEVLSADSIKDDKGKVQAQRRWRYIIELTLSSELGGDTEITVREPVRGTWHIVSASHPNKRSGENAQDFQVIVPTGSTVALAYEVVTTPEGVPDDFH